MSKRLQVLLPDTEMDEIRKAARREGVPVGEWVRKALRTVRSGQPAHEPAVKLAAVREAARHSFPAPDIKQMLAEIERGYLE